MKIRFMQIGMGPLGRRISTFIHERSDFQLVSAIDTDPVLVEERIEKVIGVINGDIATGAIILNAI